MKITKSLKITLQWSILVVAYVYLIYKLSVYQDYNTVLLCFTQTNWFHWVALGLCVLLLPLNFFTECWKWRALLHEQIVLSFKTSALSVLLGQIGAFPTPNRLGEYPARVLVLPEGKRVSAVAMGFWGSVVQTVVMICCGLIGALIFLMLPKHNSLALHSYLIAAFVILILLCVLLFFLPMLIRWLQRFLSNSKFLDQFLILLTQTSLHKIFKISFITLLRYLVFCTQFYLMLRFCGVSLSLLQALAGIPLVYLFVTVTPSIGWSDFVVRGSYSVFILSFFSVNTAGIAVASMLLWFLNSCVLMLISSIFWGKFNVNF